MAMRDESLQLTHNWNPTADPRGPLKNPADPRLNTAALRHPKRNATEVSKLLSLERGIG